MKNSSERGFDNERKRREKMSDFFSALRFVVPNLPPKASQEQIVKGTIDCIKSLERERERLENLKKSLPPPAGKSSAIKVTVATSGVTFFGAHLVFRRHLATEVLKIFEKYGAEVLAANVAVEELGERGKVLVVAVTAVVGRGGGDTAEMIRREISNL